MHLTKRILPFIITQALLGKTWADQAVFDSPGDIGSIRVGDDGGLFVAVYCDEWDLKRDDEPDTAQAEGIGSFKLVIEVGAARPVVVETDDEGPKTRITATDQGLEWQIGMISRQCIDTLLSTGPAFPWSRLFLRFVGGKIERYSIRRGGPPNDGKSPAARYASCVSLMKIAVVCTEPPRGQLISAETAPIWNDALAMMRAREDLSGLERLIRAHFEPADGKDLSEYTIDGSRMWVSPDVMASIGLADWAKAGYSADAGGTPTPDPARGDVPMDGDDMAQWLAATQPDPSQGTPNG